MPRTSRVDIGGEYYHVINRANGRFQIFNNKEDYQLFEKLLEEMKELFSVEVLAYVVMPNHWHLLIRTKQDKDLSSFMSRLTNAHTRKVHALTKTNGSGHLYQGRYKSFLVEGDIYLRTLIKYIERNPVRAKLVKSCENWQWSSAYRSLCGTTKEKKLIDTAPAELPEDYSRWINLPQTEQEVESIRNSVNKGKPYGGEGWVEKMITKYSLQSSLKGSGRPKKIRPHKV